MSKIEGRCTQCTSVNKQDFSSEDQTQFGFGKKHGTEYLYCSECGRNTLHNRCGSSVPTAADGR